MKIIGHAASVTGEKRSRGPNIPGRKTLRARPGGAQLNVSLQAGGFPVVEMALATTQRAFAGVEGASVVLGVGNRPVQ
jgi:hypothetical protein